MKKTIMTNNPLVWEKLGTKQTVVFKDVSYRGLLTEARDRIHRGWILLTHPLYGSVKPGETPYRSLILSEREGGVDERSLRLIEEAVAACDKFVDRTGVFRPGTLKDFQTVDLALLMSALRSDE